jgi:hypothetical protein
MVSNFEDILLFFLAQHCRFSSHQFQGEIIMKLNLCSLALLSSIFIIAACEGGGGGATTSSG